MREGRIWILLGVAAMVAVSTAQAAEPAVDPVDGAWSRWELASTAERIAEEEHLDARLVTSLIQVESDFDPSAVSRRGALGLMQLMPATARRLGVEKPLDPEQNLRAGVRELRRLIDRYGGDLVLALAAYNAGEGAVERYGGVPPFSETRDYIDRILSLYTGRPYRLGPRRFHRPVRLLKDSSGTVLITKTGKGDARATRQPVLGGGFGR